MLRSVAFTPAICLLLLAMTVSPCGAGRTFMNPVIPGDHPDPTLTRIGKDFYTTGSSFNPTPVIYHSTDLVHWEAISQPVDAGWKDYGDSPMGGVWGGKLVFHKGAYWHFFGHWGTMYFTKAPKPSGPWGQIEKMNCPPGVPGLGQDNSIFQDDDGSWFILTKSGKENNFIIELGDDGQPAGKILDLRWLNPPPDFPYGWAEGPVMCKRNGFYYYLVSQSAGAREFVFRSAKLTDQKTDWEYLGELFNNEGRDGSLFQAPAHNSEPVMLDDGTWWSIYHSWAMSGGNQEWAGQGRQGLLCQVRWDGNGKPTADYPADKPFPAPNLPDSGIPWMVPKSDFFDSTNLNPEWSFLGRTPRELYNLSERPGWLRLRSADKAKTVVKNDGEHAYSLITRLDFDATSPLQEAGIRIITGKEQRFVKLYSSFSDGHKVVCFTFEKTYYESENISGNVVWLKLVRNGHTLTAYFGPDGIGWTKVGESMDVSALDTQQPDFNAWTGNRQGLYVQKGTADFDLYVYRDAYTPIPAGYPADRSGGQVREGALENLRDGDWALYAGVEFGPGVYGVRNGSFEIEAAGPIAATSKGSIEVWLDAIGAGRMIAICPVPGAGPETRRIAVDSTPVTGRHDVYLRFKAAEKDASIKLFNFVFAARISPRLMSAAVRNNPRVVELKLDRPGQGLPQASRFHLSRVPAGKIPVLKAGPDAADPSMLRLELDSEVRNADRLLLSYAGTAADASLIGFEDRVVDNFLPGSQARITGCGTSDNGESVLVTLNKKIGRVPSSGWDLRRNGTNVIGVKSVDLSSDGLLVDLSLSEKVFYEDVLSLDFSSPESGIMSQAGVQVLNRAPGRPLSILSSGLGEAGGVVLVEFNKSLSDPSERKTDFSLKINGKQAPVLFASHELNVLKLTTSSRIGFGDTVEVSGKKGSVSDLHSGTVDEFTVIVSNSLPPPLPIPGRIQAESFAVQKGIQTETTTDEGEGLNVGWVDKGDYMDYDVTVKKKKKYTVSFRLASPEGTGRLILRILGATGTTDLCTIQAPRTGGWQAWETVSAVINLPRGSYTIRLQAVDGGVNINWIEFR